MHIIGLFLGMAKKTKKKNASKKKINKVLAKQIEHLETLLSFSMRSIDGRYEQTDSLFTNQVVKIRRQIEKVKENQ